MQAPIAGGFDHTELNGLFSADTRDLLNVVLMLDQRRRRWDNIKAELTQCLMLAGNCGYFFFDNGPRCVSRYSK